jgi:hypothetical protein
MPKKIECEYCKKKFGCRIIADHYGECLINKHVDESGYLIRFFSHGITGEVYFIYAIVGSKCNFNDIDKFLRKTWCECCNHLSQFMEFGSVDELKKTKKICTYEENDRFCYEYDMGSTTTIYFEILKRLNGDEINNKIKILKQNDELLIKCCKCKEKAIFWIETIPLCGQCSSMMNKDDSEMLSDIVNSPRTGVCGYS